MRCRSALVLGVLPLAVPLAAQSRSPLPVLVNVSVAYDAHEELGLLYGDPESLDDPEYGFRIAVRLPKRLYAGVGLTRWRRSTYADPRGSGFCDCLEYVAFVSQTTVPQIFLQWHPIASRRVDPFVRAGAGRAGGEWYRWGIGNMEHGWRTDTFGTLGAGADLRVLQSIYLSLALDYTHVAVPENKTGFIRRTTSLGLGLTVR